MAMVPLWMVAAKLLELLMAKLHSQLTKLWQQMENASSGLTM